MANTTTPSSATTANVALATNVSQTQTTAKIGKVIMTILIIAIILIVVVFLAMRARTTISITGGVKATPTEELIPISTTEWTWVDVDSNRESNWFDITDRNLDWFLAIDGDTKHPFLISLKSNHDKHFGNGIRKLGFCLKPGQGVTNAKIRFKRIPK